MSKWTFFGKNIKDSFERENEIQTYWNPLGKSVRQRKSSSSGTVGLPKRIQQDSPAAAFKETKQPYNQSKGIT